MNIDGYDFYFFLMKEDYMLEMGWATLLGTLLALPLENLLHTNFNLKNK